LRRVETARDDFAPDLKFSSGFEGTPAFKFAWLSTIDPLIS
jgi:hypothetical protein